MKNVQGYHLYISHGLIKPIKSAFINKSNTKFSCLISLIKSVTKTNIKILIRDIWGVDNRKGHNYQNHDFELTQLLYAIHHGD